MKVIESVSLELRRERGIERKDFFAFFSLAPRVGRSGEEEKTHLATLPLSLSPSLSLSQPDPVTPKAPLYAPYYGATAPLFATTQRLGVDPVPSFAPLGSTFLSDQYAAVETLGIASFLNETSPVNGVSYPRAVRTPTENVTAVYWGYDGQPMLATPPRLYNQFVRKVAETRGNTEAQNARLLTNARRSSTPGWPTSGR